MKASIVLAALFALCGGFLSVADFIHVTPAALLVLPFPAVAFGAALGATMGET